MRRRNFVKGAIAGTVLGIFPTQAFAQRDSINGNLNVANIARRYIGKRAGPRYNTWMFGVTVLTEAKAFGPYYGNNGQYAWGRQIPWASVNVGDFVQFEGTAAFRNCNGRGKVYWACNGRCTLIVTGRSGNTIDVAYQYKEHVVKTARITITDFSHTCGKASDVYFYRPQFR